MAPSLRYTLLALSVSLLSSCCCSSLSAPANDTSSPKKRTDMASHLPPRQAESVQVLWNPSLPAEAVHVAVLNAPAADEGKALSTLKRQAARLGANALSHIRIEEGVMSCEALLLYP